MCFLFHPTEAVNEAAMCRNMPLLWQYLRRCTLHPALLLLYLIYEDFHLPPNEGHNRLSADLSGALKHVQMTLQVNVSRGSCLVRAGKVFAAAAHCFSSSTRSQMPDSSAGWLAFFFCLFFTSSVDSKLKTGVTLSSSHCKKNQAKREQKRVHSAQVLSSTLLHIWRNSPRCCHGGFSGCLLCLWCHCHMSNKDRNATWWQCCSPFKDRGACWSLAHSASAPQGKRLLRALKNVYAWREHGTARIGIL